MKHIGSKKGFTLTELIVVVVVFGLIQAAAFSFFMVSINVTSFVNKTTETQAEMRAMLSTIQKQARVAERAMIMDKIPTISDLGGWEDGTLVFYLKKSGTQATLVVRELREGALRDDPKISTKYEFPNIENFNVEFSGSLIPDAADAENSHEKHAVTVELSVAASKNIKPTKLTDSFYLGNLATYTDDDEPDGRELMPIGDPPYFTLVITPSKAFGTS